jgi:hypothetical protein
MCQTSHPTRIISPVGAPEAQASVACFAWDDSAHPTSRLLNVASPPRNEMHMSVMDRLTCGITNIDAYVESADRLVPCKDIRSRLIQ